MNVLCFGQFEPEGGAAAGFGVEADLAVHAFDRFLDDAEADAGAGIVLVTVKAGEDAKDAVLVGGGNADAVVADEEAKEGFAGRGVAVRETFFGPNPDPGGLARVDEFDGVSKQVRKYLREQGFGAND